MNGKPTFERKTAPEPDFTPAEREIVTRAAGTVAGLPQRVPSSGGLAAVCATHPSDGPEQPQERDRACTGVIGALTPKAA